MIRSAIMAAVAVALLAPAVGAQPGGFHVTDATVVKGKLQWNETLVVPVTKEIEVTVNINGMNVLQKRAVTTHETVSITKETDLKVLKVTDGAGKAIAADKVAELLKNKTPVVIVHGAVAEKHRKLFKETTVFIEMPNEGGMGPGTAPVGPGGPVAPAVEPKVAPPISLPPGEKKQR